MNWRLFEPVNFRFNLADQWIKLWYFHGIIALLMLPEAKQISFILRPPAMEKQLILPLDQLTDLLDPR